MEFLVPFLFVCRKRLSEKNLGLFQFLEFIFWPCIFGAGFFVVEILVDLIILGVQECEKLDFIG